MAAATAACTRAPGSSSSSIVNSKPMVLPSRHRLPVRLFNSDSTFSLSIQSAYAFSLDTDSFWITTCVESLTHSWMLLLTRICFRFYPRMPPPSGAKSFTVGYSVCGRSPGMVYLLQHTQAVMARAFQIIQKANIFLPHAVMGSTLLALVYPPSFTWFTNRYYAPALGFLMFAVGINLNPEDFIQAFKRPLVIFIGYLGQFFLKPLLGVLFASIAVSFLHLPQALGSGIILVSCVSGAQLSNYATFLVQPLMAPISIVMTALSTATAVVVTPALTLLLLGRRLPIDVNGMMVNITQIVVVPIAAGIALNRFAAPISRSIRPVMPLLSVIVTSLCVGSPLAMNIAAVRSPFGLAVTFLVFGFHAAGFLLGFHLPGLIFSKSSDVVDLQKTISFETGMQSSLLGLALANKFFNDPLVGLPPAISTVLMSLMGFALVLYWTKGENKVVL